MMKLLSLWWGRFFLWVTQPAVIALIIVSTIIFAVTFLYFDVPTVGLAVKNFILHTVPTWWVAGKRTLVSHAPLWLKSSLAFVRKFFTKKLWKAFLKLFTGVLIFESVVNYCNLKLKHLKFIFDEMLEKWKSLRPQTKNAILLSSACLLWIPLGSWILLVVPIAVLGNIFKWLIRVTVMKFGPAIAFGKLVSWVGSKIRCWIRKTVFFKAGMIFWYRYAWRHVLARQRKVRKTVQASKVAQKVIQIADEQHKSLTEKLGDRLVEKAEEIVIPQTEKEHV